MVLRVGVLGAASVVPMALLRPAGAEPDVVVTAIAARDRERPRRFAERHGIREVHQGYAALLAGPGIDAVYNPLPNGLHGRWTIAVLEAGKHVLCEKPFTANAQEAEAVAEVARRAGLVVMEAFHYRYHALTARMLEPRAELGPLRRIDTRFAFPFLPAKNIRWNLGLAGGATMDVGCYAMHLLRTLAGAEPRIASATAKLRHPGVDRSGSIDISMLSHRIFTAGPRVIGERGTMRVFNPFAPQVFHRLAIRTGGQRRVEHVDRKPSSYAAQLHAFAGAVLCGEPVATGIDDAVANMRALDACYAAAGLPRREPTV